jgi:hypothetical protein
MFKFYLMSYFTLNSPRYNIDASAPILAEGESPIYWAWGELEIDKINFK